MVGRVLRVALASAGLLAGAAAHAAGPQVSAPAGRLEGVVVAGAQPVEGFFGIPFAAPPVGRLRWRAPQPAPRWSGVRPATSFGARCMQQPLYSDMIFRSPGPSEDCLYLNVWRPAGTRASAGLPVLVYIHGGGFLAGDGSERRYDGASIAGAGVVVVTLNYRLGVFGFLAHPELTAESPQHASGNYGLLDQAAALAWVRANVASFGGDPRRITIGGESAGSMSVSALMASPLTRSTIAGAIGESGAIMAPVFRPATLAEAEAAGQAFAAPIGGTSLAALRAIPADALLAAQGVASPGTRFGAIVDGYLLRESPTVTFQSGHQARVPLLVGSNSQEAGYQAILGDQPATVAGYRAALLQQFGDKAAGIERLYPAADDAAVPAIATALASDRFLAHPTWKWFDLQRRVGVPVYYYHYTRVRPAALGEAAGPQPIGAIHSAEIEYALGNLDINSRYGWTDEDRRTSTAMRGYWVNFIKTGNPNGAGLPAWPAAGTAAVPMRQVIDAATHSEPFADQSRYQAMDALLTPR